MSEHRTKSAALPSGRSNRRTPNGARPGSSHAQNAQRTLERYLALASAERQIGNMVEAENYYQYAEHYFRSMRSDSERT